MLWIWLPLTLGDMNLSRWVFRIWINDAGMIPRTNGENINVEYENVEFQKCRIRCKNVDYKKCYT